MRLMRRYSITPRMRKYRSSRHPGFFLLLLFVLLYFCFSGMKFTGTRRQPEKCLAGHGRPESFGDLEREQDKEQEQEQE